MITLPPLLFLAGSPGPLELLVIFVVVLVLFGPRKLPEIARSLGRMLSELRKASEDFRSQVMSIDAEGKGGVPNSLPDAAEPVAGPATAYDAEPEAGQPVNPGPDTKRLVIVTTARSDNGGDRRLQNSDNGGDRRLQNMEPAVLGRTSVGRDNDETLDNDVHASKEDEET